MFRDEDKFYLKKLTKASLLFFVVIIYCCLGCNKKVEGLGEIETIAVKKISLSISSSNESGASQDIDSDLYFCDIVRKYLQMCPQELEKRSKNGKEDSRYIENPQEWQKYCLRQLAEEKPKKKSRAFLICAVETGYCDNEVKGDPQIMECAKSHGWLEK